MSVTTQSTQTNSSEPGTSGATGWNARRSGRFHAFAAGGWPVRCGTRASQSRTGRPCVSLAPASSESGEASTARSVGGSTRRGFSASRAMSTTWPWTRLTRWPEGRALTTDLAGLARFRAAEFAQYQRTEPPNQFETFGTPYGARRVVPRGEAVDADRRILRGTGCCPGLAEGALRIVLQPTDDLDVTGKILTTVRTDPGWGPLFPSVKGLLIERGSILSHSAVLARELGIPAVVVGRGLTATVRDGERVRLDGAAGIVERLDESEDRSP